MQPAPIDGAPRRSRPMPLVLVLLLAVAALLALGLFRTGFGAAGPTFHATAYEPAAAAADFTLTDHTGSELTLSDLQGHPILLFFGYTHCPDVCPLTLTRLRDALDEAGAGPGDARILLVTVDPERDTQEVLARYVAAFGPDVTGLRGPPERLDEVYRAYGVHVATDHADASMVMHTSAVFGIDRHGDLRVLLRPDVAKEELHADVETLLEI